MTKARSTPAAAAAAAKKPKPRRAGAAAAGAAGDLFALPAALAGGPAGAAASPERVERRRSKGVVDNPAYGAAPSTGPVVDDVIASPIGPLRLVADDRALLAVHFPNHPDGALLRPAAAANDAAPRAHPILREAARQLAEYFAGTRRDFDLPLATGGTAFQKEVWRGLRDIPYAATWSYGELATRVGNPNASRAVGAANGMNPIPIIVPCHRVIGANGSLTGFGGGEPTKRWLLDHEAKVAGLRLL
jgi:methylated-DNA-[protein]-cysteine S-methyltransferase